MSQLPAPDSGKDELLNAFQAVARAMVAITARSLGGLDSEVTVSQYRALVALVSLGQQRTSDLAQELGVATSTATRLADRLVAKGLITRTRRRDDRRAAWLGLTQEGKALLGNAMKLRRAEIHSLLRAVPSITKEGREVAALLNAFAEAANEPVDTEWWVRWLNCDQSDDVEPAAGQSRTTSS
ncbi:MarR family winged helix-turn-helix transcriptional regulator [Saccharopolyspora mangrovi]|nr:MarR family winged helix-turn-helix transcriptional regulator [Saccharopolyspora sp. S2-29]